MIESAPISPPARSPETEERFGGRFDFQGSLRARAARGMLINTAFTVALGLLGLLKGVILAGFLSRSDYGLWGIVVVSLSTLLWFKQAGIGDKFIQQDELDQEQAFQKAFTLELVVTAACAALIAIALPILVLIYNLPELVAPAAVIAATLLVSVLQAPLWVYYRKMDFGRQRALAALDPVVGFVASVLLAIAGAGYWAFVGGVAAGACATSVAAVVASPFKLRLRYEAGTLRGYWSFSGPLIVAGAAGFVTAWTALLTAKLALGLAAVGVIALAANISQFTDRVDELVTGSLYPAICAVKDRRALLYESLVKSNRLALMWAVPFGIAITLFCSDLVQFGIGPRWRPAVTVLEVYGVAAAVNHVGFNWTAYLRALGMTRPIAAETAAAATVFVASAAPLVVLLGLRGLAIAVALQGAAALALRAYYLQRIFPGFDFLRHAARSFLPTIPAAGAVLVMRAVESGPRTLALALAELATYVLIMAASTWYLESGLIREAASHLLDRGAAAAVS